MTLLIAGIDEAGRGSLAGPVVAAVVIFKPSQDKSKYTDSKLLKPAQREALFEQIISESFAYGIGVIDNLIIDKINILQANHLAMKKALHKLGHNPDVVLIDGNQQVPELPFKQKTVVKGDLRVPVISAASIVAKVVRDRIMSGYGKVYADYCFDIHKGYGTALHYEKIDLYGLCPIHRVSFNKKFFSQQLEMFRMA